MFDTDIWAIIQSYCDSLPLMGIAFRLGAQSEQDAEDAIQDAKIIAFLNFESLRNPLAFRPRFITLLRTSVSKLRRREYNTLKTYLAVYGERSDTDLFFDESAKAYFGSEALGQLLVAIWTLREQSRDVYLFRALGLSYRDIAQRLFIKEAGARKQFEKASRVISKALSTYQRNEKGAPGRFERVEAAKCTRTWLAQCDGDKHKHHRWSIRVEAAIGILKR